jgi:potassium channel subfamily K
MTAYLFFTYIFVGCMYYITTNSLEFLGNPGEPANVTFLEAVYFLFVTMFTVGYGDFYPGTVECQIATIFIATLGVMVTSTGLSVVANFIIDMRDDLIEHTRALAIKNGGESKAVDIDAALQTGPRKLGTGYSGPWYRRAYQVFVDVRRAWPILDGLAYLWAYLIATGAFWIWFQRLRYPAADQFTSLVDGLYFVFITGASVGYGDVGVVGRDGWALMIFFIPLTCAFVSTQLNEITKMFISDK